LTVITDRLVITEGARVEWFAAIRRDARVEQCSIRELAERYHVQRRTMRAGPVGEPEPGGE